MTALNLSASLALGAPDSPELRCVQRIVGATPSGGWGPQTQAAVVAWNLAHLPHAASTVHNVGGLPYLSTWTAASWQAARGLYLPAARDPWELEVDVSQFNGPIAAETWQLLAAWGVRAAYVRLGCGLTLDTLAIAHATGATAAVIAPGYYWPLLPGEDPAAQGRAFAAAILAAPAAQLLPVVDYEVRPVPPAALRSFVAALGQRCAVYLSPAFVAGWGGDVDLAAVAATCPLWCAAYAAREPSAPAPWEAIAAWQFEATARLPGGGALDCDWIVDREALAIG